MILSYLWIDIEVNGLESANHVEFIDAEILKVESYGHALNH